MTRWKWLAGGAFVLLPSLPVLAQGPTQGPLLHVTRNSIFKSCTADTTAQQPGIVYPNTEIEFSLAINPAAHGNLLVGMQQDRWSNGGARGQRGEYTYNAGTTFMPSSTPDVTKCQGGPWFRSSDPWVSFSPDGTAYFSELVTNELKNPNLFGQSGQTVSQSLDGGATWGLPWTLIISPRTPPKEPQRLNDKNSLLADLFDSKYAYVVWDQLSSFKPGYGYNDESGDDGNGSGDAAVAGMVEGGDVMALTHRVMQWAKAHPVAADKASTVPKFVTGPALFSRTTDHGATWSVPTVAYNPGKNYQTLGNQIVQLPNHKLLDFFARINDLTGATQIGFVESSDHGASWSAAALPFDLVGQDTYTPNLQQFIRSADVLPAMTVDEAHNIIYLAWQDSRFTGDDEAVVAFSPDNGRFWFGPIRVNQTPRNRNPLFQQALIPSVATTSDGTVVVTYYDFRNDKPGAATDLTDYWAVFCNPLTSPDVCQSTSDWSTELRVTKTSFDYDQAPVANGHFVGDYMSLKSFGQTVWSAFGQATGMNLTDLFMRQITVPSGSVVAAR